MNDWMLYDGSELFSCSAFHGEALRFFRFVGHTLAVTPLIIAKDILHCIYSELNFNSFFSNSERLSFSCIEDLSHLFTLENDAFEVQSSRKVRYYAISLKTVRSDRTTVANEILRAFTKNTRDYIVILFRHEKVCMLAFAMKTSGCISYFSDWFSETGVSNISNRIVLDNLSLQTSNTFFIDFAYMSARSYYTHPISKDYAHAAWYEAYNFYEGEENISYLIWKDVAPMILFAHIYEYRDDYIDLPIADDYRDDVFEESEYDLLLKELELEEVLASQLYDFTADDDEYMDDEFFDDYEQIDASNIPPEIMNDPVKLLEWLNKTREDELDEEEW